MPYDGELTCEHLDSLSPAAYRCGQVWGISIAVAGVRFYHQGSANLVDELVRERGVEDNFFRPLGQDLEFVTAAELSRLPEEIGAVSREIEVAALPRADLG